MNRPSTSTPSPFLLAARAPCLAATGAAASAGCSSTTSAPPTLVNSTLTGNTAGGGDGLVEQGLVEPERLLELFEEIEPELYRYPAIDPPSFRRAVEELVREKTP